MTETVVTRFAPSPTGFLHIGGARTALFNWLLARHYGGKFLLRIEDTDRERSTQEAIDAIIDGMKWMGLDWDDEIVFQFSRAERHREVAEQLLSSGHAYKCYCSKEELDTMREEARANGKPPKYNGMWRDRDPSQAPDGVDPVVRFKAPQSGEVVINDKVQGQVKIKADQLDDLIILRSDGTPTYMLSVIVDDHDMGITHIVRGDDHLTNAARQSMMYQALGWDIPVFAHIPLIHGPDGAKLSKRHGALGIEAYRDMGYMAEGMRNYLVRLGWSHGNDETFTTEQMIEWFDIDGINKAPSRLDFKKMDSINGWHIREADPAHLSVLVEPMLEHTLTDETRHKLNIAMPGLRERAKTLKDIVDGAGFIFSTRPLSFDDKAKKQLDDDAVRARLGRLTTVLNDHTGDWTVEALEPIVKSFAETEDIGLGKVAQPLRAALTGTTVSPSIYDVMVVLGREESMARLSDQSA